MRMGAAMDGSIARARAVTKWGLVAVFAGVLSILALVGFSGCEQGHPPADAGAQLEAGTQPDVGASEAQASRWPPDESTKADPPPPPLPPDTRTPAQIIAAACPPGMCKGRSIPTTFGASPNLAIIPSSYTVPAWWIDPANSIGCASNSNSGTSATCTGGCSGSTCPSGIGPLLSWQELAVHRWGFQGGLCPTPRIQQNTTVTFLSNDANTDPVSFCPQVELGAYVLLVGNLGAGQQVCSGTISGVTNLTRGAVATGLTQVTLPCNAAVGDLVFDSTQSAYFWTYKVNSAAPAYFATTPISVSTLGTTFNTIGYVPISNGDSVTVYSPVSLDVTEYSPFYVQDPVTALSYLANMSVAFSGNQRDPVALGGVGQGVIYQNVAFNRNIQYMRQSSKASAFVNAFIVGGASIRDVLLYSPPSSQYVFAVGIYGGVVGSTNSNEQAFNMSGTSLDLDTIVVSTSSALQQADLRDGYLNEVYIDTSSTINARQNVGLNSGIDAGPFVWGPGTLTVNGPGRISYPSGSGQAAATFLMATLQIDRQSKTCLCNPNIADGGVGPCNLTVSAANLDTTLGATIPNACFCNAGGGAICNFLGP